jgi:hypothetical protein
MWDGFVDASLPSGPDPQTICVNEPTASAVCDRNFGQVDPNNPNVDAMVCGPSTYDCTLPPLAPVTWPGLTN